GGAVLRQRAQPAPDPFRSKLRRIERNREHRLLRRNAERRARIRKGCRNRRNARPHRSGTGAPDRSDAADQQRGDRGEQSGAYGVVILSQRRKDAKTRRKEQRRGILWMKMQSAHMSSIAR